MAKKWKANVELLERVARKLNRMRHKKHFYMPAFVAKTECGTAACIGGHGLLLEGYKPLYSKRFDEDVALEVLPPGADRPVKAWAAARRLFRLSPAEARLLFQSDCWPYEYDPTEPKDAAVRIRRFIATKGKE